ncbi:hypothetical protein VTJ49DRAFT_1488 [Mycothermus thermophilus]|uniref:Uncharacterized protein n=1 Tax=Humicola insolens TaxID=85995 RepID=A0ABR3VCB4_HUMIN
MFLHSGASLHGHEYSSRPSTTALQSSPNLRAPLLRSAFAPPKQRAAIRTGPDGSPAPALRQRPASDYIPRDSSPAVRFRIPHDDEDDDRPPPTPSAHDESAAVSESELSDAALSHDGASLARSAAPSRHRKGPRRSVRKSSTTYYLGYPTPRIIGKTRVVQKVFLPRLLLQLQTISAEGRLQPVLEVFPAARIAGPVAAPRLAKRFPAIFGVRHHLGYDDIVLVRRDDGDDSTETDEEVFEGRNRLAVYSPLKHSEDAEIVLDDGSVWVARPLPNGSFDFVHTDAEGKTTTARWARRHASGGVAGQSLSDSSPRYTFSIINPTTRRHPVMATLTRATLDIQDKYTSVSCSHAKRPPVARAGRSQSLTSTSPGLARPVPYSPTNQSSSSGCPSECENDSAVFIPTTPSDLDASASPRTTYTVDDATKMLIAVSAIWVCLRSSWAQAAGGGPTSAPLPPTSSCSSSSAPDWNTNTASAAAAAAISSPTRTRGTRRNTWTTRCPSTSTDYPAVDSHKTSPPTSGSLSKRASMPIPLFSSHCDAPAPAVSTSAAPSPVPSRAATPTSISSVGMAPRRATSSGAAFMQRRLRQVSAAASTAGDKLADEMDGSNDGGAVDAGRDETRLLTGPVSGKSDREGQRGGEDGDKERDGPARGILKTAATGNKEEEVVEEEKKKEKKRPRPISEGLTLTFAASSSPNEPEKVPMSARTPRFFARGLDENEPRRHSFMLLRRERGSRRSVADVESSGDASHGTKSGARGKVQFDGGKDSGRAGGMRSRLARWVSRKLGSGSGSEGKKSR